LITAKNEVRGWDLYTTTELYKSLAKNKLKTKKQNKPVEDLTTIYSYSKYDKIVEKDMNQKEKALRSEIKYYMKHLDQINRIRQLESELAYIKKSINAVQVCYE
jgi:cupin superfamily acireductone dioxygenase involved in methionine salvage